MNATISVNDVSGIVRSGNIAVKSLQAARSLEAWVAAMGTKIFTGIAYAFTLPFLLILWVLLEVVVRRLNKRRPPSMPLHAQNYKAFRLRFQELTALSNTLRPIAAIDVSRETWLNRMFAKQAVKVAKIVIQHRDAMDGALQALDKPYAPLPNGWNVFTSDKRWEGRPTPYEYIV
ncbi:MAG: hypothetical protein IT270_17680 [Saprospiraceae bacterium]|nr:hypothetical protein [Saprospiraceae bacterium]